MNYNRTEMTKETLDEVFSERNNGHLSSMSSSERFENAIKNCFELIKRNTSNVELKGKILDVLEPQKRTFKDVLFKRYPAVSVAEVLFSSFDGQNVKIGGNNLKQLPPSNFEKPERRTVAGLIKLKDGGNFIFAYNETSNKLEITAVRAVETYGPHNKLCEVRDFMYLEDGDKVDSIITIAHRYGDYRGLENFEVGQTEENKFLKIGKTLKYEYEVAKGIIKPKTETKHENKENQRQKEDKNGLNQQKRKVRKTVDNEKGLWA